MSKFRKELNKYKFASLSLILGGLFFGYETGISLAIIGIIVDIFIIYRKELKKGEINKNNVILSKQALVVWSIISLGFSIFYTIVICIGTGANGHSTLIDSWINFTQPLIKITSDYIPAINHYVKNLTEIGQEWRIGRLTNLCTVLLIANTIFAIILPFDFRNRVRRVTEKFYSDIKKDNSDCYICVWFKQCFKLLFGICLSFILIYLCLQPIFFGSTIEYGTRKFELLIPLSTVGFYFLLHGTIAVITAFIIINYQFVIKSISGKSLERNK
ncbi:MAG: hypothetical protein PQ612_09605 [Rickettsiales bacterium]|nr:hypothetical protein [Pseudomonadota bacterium]MDA0966049.1 hypothetical protein [Pseudomonadota bacterium]MDG4544231.1 hypothetical protein [Rickettsiales bacterium]MDG4546410.1 hypothetical protein [Rickettsiales bacterium]MDG4548555.1 hypothetical protein [Rickettsiales bacterium]